jgi:hypothetical protein
MKGRQVRGENDTVTIVAAESITAFCCVNTQGCHEAADEVVGVAMHDTDSGSPISVGVGRIEVALSGAAVTANTPLEVDASGKLIDYSSGIVVGYSIDSSTDADQYIRFLLVHGGSAA